MNTEIEHVLRELEEGKAILIDVREQEEWDQGHLQHSRLIPLSKLNEGDSISHGLPKDKTIYLHCRRGGRAMQAEEILKKQYPKAVALQFSYDELKKEGL